MTHEENCWLAAQTAIAGLCLAQAGRLRERPDAASPRISARIGGLEEAASIARTAPVPSHDVWKVRAVAAEEQLAQLRDVVFRFDPERNSAAGLQHVLWERLKGVGRPRAGDVESPEAGEQTVEA